MEILIGSLMGFALIGQKSRTSHSERMAAREQARASRMAALEPEPELFSPAMVGRLMTRVRPWSFMTFAICKAQRRKRLADCKVAAVESIEWGGGVVRMGCPSATNQQRHCLRSQIGRR